MSTEKRKQQDKARLRQTNMIEALKRTPSMTELIPVYLNQIDHPNFNRGIYAALIPEKNVKEVLTRDDWDFQPNDAYPGTAIYGGEEVRYHRYSHDGGIEPIVICREFHGLTEDYDEIAEEFRHYHNLYHDRKLDHYFKFDDAGGKSLIAILEPNLIKIRLKELRQYLAVKSMYLSIQFDFKEYSPFHLEELDLKEDDSLNESGDNFVYSIHYSDQKGMGGIHACSWAHGKFLIPPLPKEKSGAYGWAKPEPEKRVEFVLGLNDLGEEVETGSKEANDLFGNRGGPVNYLTPVFFTKQVLDKYYRETKYSVEDGYLRCASLWGMQMDNHHETHVVAWVSDLWRDLPFQEQLHWRQYNVPRTGGMSSTFFERQIEAKFSDSEHPEHVFKHAFQNFEKRCQEKMNWKLFVPLTKEDEHFFTRIRVPAGDEQIDFDDLVAGLTKTLVDSLNEKELNKLIPEEERKELKGSISRLEAALRSCGAAGFEPNIKFLRNLQSLRSAGTAHRKGSNYRKIAQEMGVSDRSLQLVFVETLQKAIELIRYLESEVENGNLQSENDKGSTSE